MTDNFSALDDVLKDEIRRAFEACQSQAEYDELKTQLTAYVEDQHKNAWKLLKDQIKEHFSEYEITFSDRRILVYDRYVSYTIDDCGWSLHEVSSDDCTSAADLEDLASRAQSIEDSIERDDILDKVRQYFELKPRRE